MPSHRSYECVTTGSTCTLVGSRVVTYRVTATATTDHVSVSVLDTLFLIVLARRTSWIPVSCFHQVSDWEWSLGPLVHWGPVGSCDRVLDELRLDDGSRSTSGPVFRPRCFPSGGLGGQVGPLSFDQGDGGHHPDGPVSHKVSVGSPRTLRDLRESPSLT